MQYVALSPRSSVLVTQERFQRGGVQAADREAELVEDREAIDTGLCQLSDRDQLILRAFYLEDRTRAEICNALGVTDTQFRVALFRAKERFRKIYRQSLKRRAATSH